MPGPSLISILRRRFAAAVARVAAAEPHQIDPQVRAAQDPRFGDYQCNAALSLARRLKAAPRELAERIVAALDLADLCQRPEVAGPGFINVRLKNAALARQLSAIPAPPAEAEGGAGAAGEAGGTVRGAGGPAPGGVVDRLGLPAVAQPQKVVVDYSSPNIAKQMHVGHLRSTIIGDVFARVLGFAGHEVVRQNHVGDWGTQFGLLIATYRAKPIPTAARHADVLEAIERDYREAQERFQRDRGFAAAARAAVGALQSGAADACRVWEQLCAQSRRAFLDIYRRLDVLLEDGDVCGESFYNDRLAGLVAELRALLPRRDRSRPPAGGWAELREDRGAQCVFLYDGRGQPRFRKPDGDELPMIIQKSDGAYLYATTDLAALRYRIKELGARQIIYVTDARQKLHFAMLFAVARAAGWAGPDVRLEHATFGSVLGQDRRPLRTRAGRNVRLRELLDEAERRAGALLESRAVEPGRRAAGAAPPGPVFSEPQKRQIARRIGVAAVKYADLSRDRNSDYVFDWDKMLTLQGNTAPYLLYAYARIRSICRKAAERCAALYGPQAPLTLDQPTERALGLRLARLPETIDSVASELAPHLLCNYLYELAGDFMRFYETCPVLQASDRPTRLSRLRLCDLTARTLRLGLWLLGIEPVERM